MAMYGSVAFVSASGETTSVKPRMSPALAGTVSTSAAVRTARVIAFTTPPFEKEGRHAGRPSFVVQLRRTAAQIVDGRRRVGLLRVAAFDSEKRRTVRRSEEVRREPSQPVEAIAGADPESTFRHRNRERARTRWPRRKARSARCRRRANGLRIELERCDRYVCVVDDSGLGTSRAVTWVVAVGEVERVSAFRASEDAARRPELSAPESAGRRVTRAGDRGCRAWRRVQRQGDRQQTARPARARPQQIHPRA